jgi:putative peptidoglycan binding protein
MEMKRIYLVIVAVAVSFVLLESAEARGSGRSFSSAPHFSAPMVRSAPSRSFSGGPRYNSAARFSSSRTFYNRSYTAMSPRYSGATAFRNPSYVSSRARFAANRTTAFNSRTYSRSNAQLAAGNRTRGFNQGRVLARFSANNWHRSWDRGRDHFWNGHRCHFRNGFWFIYDPWSLYPYGYGYGFYPYGAYYDASYYDDNAYATDEYAPGPDTAQSDYSGDARVSDVQNALAREGYYDGAIDGTLGPATRSALRRYQRDHGLQVTGGINRAVIEALQPR